MIPRSPLEAQNRAKDGVPHNYDGKYYGSVTLKKALAKSLNCATIRLAAHIGIDNIIEMAQRLGIRNDAATLFASGHRCV